MEDTEQLDLSSQVMINGAYVHRSFLIPTVAWIVATVFILPFTFIGCRRAYLSYVRSNRRLKDGPIYWAHIALNVLFVTIVAIDPAGIFFDLSGTVNLVCLLELTIVNYSSVIYTFVGSVQHYIVQQKLVAPDWIEPFKRTFLYVNAIVGNVLLITQVALDQVNLSGITIIFLAFEGAIIGPIFCVLAVKLTRRLVAQFTSFTTVESTDDKKRKAILKGVRNFRNFTYISTTLMYNLLLIVAFIYIPRLMLPSSLIHSNSAAFPDFARHRRFKSVFKFNWIMWISYITSSYFIWRHWIKKSSFAGKLTTGSSTKTKSVGSIDSTTSNGSQTDRHMTETYSKSDHTSKNMCRTPKSSTQMSIWSGPGDRYIRKGSAPSTYHSPYQSQASMWGTSHKELSIRLDTPTARSTMSFGNSPWSMSPKAAAARGPMEHQESRASVVSTMSTGSGRRESRASVTSSIPAGSGRRESRPSMVSSIPAESGRRESRPSARALAVADVVTPTNTITPQYHSPLRAQEDITETFSFSSPTTAATSSDERPVSPATSALAAAAHGDSHGSSPTTGDNASAADSFLSTSSPFPNTWPSSSCPIPASSSPDSENEREAPRWVTGARGHRRTSHPIAC